jgi:hypothetical protein
MLSPLAVVAAAIDAEPDPARRAELDELALTLLLLGILDRQVALLRARMCRLTLDERSCGGDDDRRDPAAA